MSSYTENIILPGEHIQNVFGQFDKHMKTIEKSYHIAIVLRNDTLKLVGDEISVKRAVSVIQELLKLSENGNEITEQMLIMQYLLQKQGMMSQL